MIIPKWIDFWRCFKQDVDRLLYWNKWGLVYFNFRYIAVHTLYLIDIDPRFVQIVPKWLHVPLLSEYHVIVVDFVILEFMKIFRKKVFGKQKLESKSYVSLAVILLNRFPYIRKNKKRIMNKQQFLNLIWKYIRLKIDFELEILSPIFCLTL